MVYLRGGQKEGMQMAVLEDKNLIMARRVAEAANEKSKSEY